MASDKLMNHTQGETIITKLTSIADSLDDLAAVTPAKLGMGIATCDTPASTAAKTAALANFALVEGAPVSVQFTYANTATNATLNINNTGAKPIIYKDAAIGNDVISAGDTCTFIYTTNTYKITNIDTLTGPGSGTVRQVGAEKGLITDQNNNADIQTTGKIGLKLKSTTAFSTEAPDPVEIEDKIYPVALDAEGHPAVSVPGTEYTQGAGINISENNEITNTGVFDVTTPTSSDTTATNGDIKVTKKVVNSGVTSESVTFVKPKGINDPAFKALDSSTSGLTSDDDHVPTSKTVQDAIDTALASASVYKGTISAFNDLPTSTATVIVRKGWYYRVSTAWAAATGTPATHVGDIIIAEIDSPSKAIDSTNWSLLHNEANTDANVTQSPVSTNANYEVLFSGSADNTAHTEGAGKDSGLTYNPSTNKLTISGEVSASSYSGLPDGNTTTKGIVQLGTDADKAASGDHGHGNITNGGAITATGVDLASGDALVFADSSDNSKLKKASVTFDGSTETECLTKKGTFKAFNNYKHPTTAGNKHIPTNGATGNYLKYGGSSGTASWAAPLTTWPATAQHTDTLPSTKLLDDRFKNNETNILYGINNGVKNICDYVNPLRLNNCEIVDGEFKQTVADSKANLNFMASAVRSDGTSYALFTSATITANGEYSYEFNFPADVAAIRIGHNGTTRDAKFDINVDHFVVGTTYVISINVLNCVQSSGVYRFNKIMICTKQLWDTIGHGFMPPALPNYDLTYLQAQDRASLAEVVDSGAKNLVDIANVTTTGSSFVLDHVAISLSTGSYVFSYTSNQSTSGDVELILRKGMRVLADHKVTSTSGRIEIPFTIASTADNITLYSVRDGTYSNFMICTKAAFGVSQKFVPFGNDPFYQVPINHNMIYRGRNLGTTLTDAQHTALSSGNFTDLYLGDYWTKTVTIPAGTYTGGDGEKVTVPAQTNITLKAVIADFDTFYAGYASSYAAINTHHAAVIVTGFSNVVWNGSNNTTGGYVNSLIHKWLVGSALPQIETWFGSAKVLSHQKLLTNAITGDAASGWTWSSQKISLLSENQMYGSKVWGNSKASNGGYEPGEAFKHLNVFNHIDANLLFGNKNIWLRDIASAMGAARLLDHGYACDNASSLAGVAPAALILLS